MKFWYRARTMSSYISADSEIQTASIASLYFFCFPVLSSFILSLGSEHKQYSSLHCRDLTKTSSVFKGRGWMEGWGRGSERGWRFCPVWMSAWDRVITCWSEYDWQYYCRFRFRNERGEKTALNKQGMQQWRPGSPRVNGNSTWHARKTGYVLTLLALLDRLGSG